MTIQLAWVFRLSAWDGGCSVQNQEVPTPPTSVLPSPKYKVSGALAVETGVQEGAESSFQGRLWGGNPQHPHLGLSSAPGLLVLFFLLCQG